MFYDVVAVAGRWPRMNYDQMSGSDQRKRSKAATIPVFDPEAFRCWRLVESGPQLLRQAHLIRAREAPPDAGIDGHVHAVPTLVACLRGTTRVETAQGGLDLPAGSAALVAPGAWHRHTGLRGDTVVYAQGLMALRSDLVLLSPPRRWWLLIPQEPSRLLLERALAAEDAGQRLAAVRELVANVAREPAQALSMTESQQAMARFLWGNFIRPITAADILRASRLGRSQASLLFRSCFGEPPTQALRRSRLELARHLQAEGYSSGEVAERCGLVSRARWRRQERIASAE